MICPRCGSKLSDDAVTCGLCGQPVSNMAYPVVPAPTGSGMPQNTVAANSNRKLNVPGLVASLLFALGVFLPYVSVNLLIATGEFSLIEGEDGILFLAVAIGAVIASLVGTKAMNIVLIVLGVIAVLFVFVEAYHTFHELEYAALYSRNIGYYCTLFGSIGILGSGIYGLTKKS